MDSGTARVRGRHCGGVDDLTVMSKLPEIQTAHGLPRAGVVFTEDGEPYCGRCGGRLKDTSPNCLDPFCPHARHQLD